MKKTEKELALWLTENAIAYVNGTLDQEKIDKLNTKGFFKDDIYKDYLPEELKDDGKDKHPTKIYKHYSKQYFQKFKCESCNKISEHQTNHNSDFVWPCKECSWKPSFGKNYGNIGGLRNCRLMINIETNDKE